MTNQWVAAVSVGRVGPVTAPMPTSVYVNAERDAGLGRALGHVVAGRPTMVLAALLVTVEAQARIEGIGGIVLPFRPQAVTR